MKIQCVLVLSRKKTLTALVLSVALYFSKPVQIDLYGRLTFCKENNNVTFIYLSFLTIF